MDTVRKLINDSEKMKSTMLDRNPLQEHNETKGDSLDDRDLKTSDKIKLLWESHYELVVAQKELDFSIITHSMIKDEINKTFNNQDLLNYLVSGNVFKRICFTQIAMLFINILYENGVLSDYIVKNPGHECESY